MNTADAAQCEALRLAELKDLLGQYQKALYDLAHAETTYGIPEVATQMDQAQIKLQAAIQTITVQLRCL